MQPSLRRGVAFAEDVRFCFTVFQGYEQNEWGDTLEHTWWLEDWPACTTKWFYVWGSRSGEFCVSTTAPFKYHNTHFEPVPPWGLIFHEPWTILFPPPLEMQLIFIEYWGEPPPTMALIFLEPWTS
ncbi:hypothetical protein ES705_36493 [subsurface metagenome]